MTRKALPYVAVLLLLVGTGLVNQERIAGWIGTSGPLTQVIVIEETGQRTPQISGVLFGKTAQGLIAAKKWKCEDKDKIPPVLKPIIDQKPPVSIPWLILAREQRAVWGGPLPATDADLSAQLKAYGGW